MSAVQVGRDFGLEPNRDGRCRCIFHNDRTPSMKLYDGDRGFYCFTCHAHGDVIDLMARIGDCGKAEAMQRLNTVYGIGLDMDRRQDADMMKRVREERERRRLEREEAENDYRAAQEAVYGAEDWLDSLQSIRMETRPRDPSESISETYAKATVLAEYAREDLRDCLTRENIAWENWQKRR